MAGDEFAGQEFAVPRVVDAFHQHRDVGDPRHPPVQVGETEIAVFRPGVRDPVQIPELTGPSSASRTRRYGQVPFPSRCPVRRWHRTVRTTGEDLHREDVPTRTEYRFRHDEIDIADRLAECHLHRLSRRLHRVDGARHQRQHSAAVDVAERPALPLLDALGDHRRCVSQDFDQNPAVAAAPLFHSYCPLPYLRSFTEGLRSPDPV
ncbi:hypothetical protein Pd630_LPD06652 [Rhodococcus opacus PD630]|nr:hypothetical protein Pd630_LPD06652 [Rhodococcus opacus PD630]